MKSLIHILIMLMWITTVSAQDFSQSYTRGIDNQSSTLTTPTQTMTNAGSCTSATPMVCTWTANALVNGMAIVLSGSVPTGLTAGTTYYVVAQATNSFELAATPGGSAIASTSSTSPTATVVVSQNTLIASNKTAGSVVVPSITNVTRVNSGSAIIRRARLSTNVTTGWDQASVIVHLWSSAPTYTNGNFGQYAVATGNSGRVGKIPIVLEQNGDGAIGDNVPNNCGPIYETLVGSGNTTLYWDVEYVGANSINPISGQTFTLTLEVEK